MTAGDERPLAALEDGAADEMGARRGLGGSDFGAGIMLYIVFAIGFAIVAELIAAGHRNAQRSTAEKADAEGMLLLKDPAAMLSALRTCIELNNVVPAAGESFAELFYCWTGISTNDEDDPEWVRVARLREVLGAMGNDLDDTDRSVNGLGVAPPAPRLDTPQADTPPRG